MRYTIALQNSEQRCHVQACAGIVEFNGVRLLPYEAAMLGDALEQCAAKAEDKAATLAASLKAS